MNNDMPYHLREDAPPLAGCDRCARLSWAADELDQPCGMGQPDGTHCLGWMTVLGVLA